MKRTGWLVFCVVVLIGGGLNLIKLGAGGTNADKNKIEQAKEELLAKPVTTMQIQECKITVKALKLSYQEKDDLVIKLCIENNTPTTATLTIPLLVNSTTSSPMMRMKPEPKVFLKQDIQVAVPAGKTIEKEILLTSQTKPKNTTEEPKIVPEEFKTVTTYSAYITRADKEPGLSTLMCAFTIDKIATLSPISDKNTPLTKK